MSSLRKLPGMLNLTRKTDYALVALAELANAISSGVGPLSVRQIAQENSLPLPLLMNVLKQLHRAGLVRSTRGAHGGYSLADTPDQIELLSIINAIEGPVRLTPCCEEEQSDGPCLSCTLVQHCPVTVAIRKLNQRIITFLREVTLQDLMICDGDVILPTVGIDRPNWNGHLPVKRNHHDGD